MFDILCNPTNIQVERVVIIVAWVYIKLGRIYNSSSGMHQKHHCSYCRFVTKYQKRLNTLPNLPPLYFQLQMIELYKNPSGDIELSTKPKSEPQNDYLSQSTGSPEDIAKIAHLRETIQTLTTQIEAVSG